METEAQIPFQQLLTAIKFLTLTQKERLKQELAEEKIVKDDKAEFLEMLLNGPVYTEEQIKSIEDNRKSIAKWRTKK